MQVCVKSSLKWSILRSVKTLRIPIHNREASGEPPLTIFYPSHSYSFSQPTRWTTTSAYSTINSLLHAIKKWTTTLHPLPSTILFPLLISSLNPQLNHQSASSTIHIPLPSSHSFLQSTVEPLLCILYSSSNFSFLLTIHKMNHNSASSAINNPLPSSQYFSQSKREPPLLILYHPHSYSFFLFF